jgi:prefoldin subunit 5
MKEDTLIKMKNQVESLKNVMNFVMEKIKYLDTMAIGTLETIKNMPDYDKAIESLKNKNEKLEKEKKDGVIKQNTK